MSPLHALIHPVSLGTSTLNNTLIESQCKFQTAWALIVWPAGPVIPWRPGRSDQVSGESCGPDGRLPDASQGSKHLRHIFYRMGFNDEEIVALSGAHSLGRCHPDRSGFKGPWTNSPTTFSNLYFQELLDKKWYSPPFSHTFAFYPEMICLLCPPLLNGSAALDQ